MEQKNELHQLIANKINAGIPEDLEREMIETLRSLDEEDQTLVMASRHLAELAIEHEDMMLHYAATVVLWMTGLLNQDRVVTPDDVKLYAYNSWLLIQQALNEIVEDGISNL